MNSLLRVRKDDEDEQQSTQSPNLAEKLRDDSNGNSSVVLNSWKEIAAYLGRGVRTVQRWERNFGLPVHRPNGRDHGATLALPSELEQWLRQTPVRSGQNGDGRRDRSTTLQQQKRPQTRTPSVRTFPTVNQVPRLILSVDDEPALLYTREKVLEAEGYAVLSATNGAQALQIFSAKPVDLVLLDYQMPKMDGRTVAKEMKRRKPSVPIIMVSGNHENAASSCADCFVAKGEGPASLLATIAQSLALKEKATGSCSSASAPVDGDGGRQKKISSPKTH